jgi:hypothetical protein
MHTYEKTKGYTPQISLTLSGALRRIAWLHKETMVKTLERIVKEAALKYSLSDLCEACKGHKKQCNTCYLFQESTASFNGSEFTIG